MTAEHIDSKEQYAIKAEPIETKYPMIIYEANICNFIQGINVKAQSLAKNQLHQVDCPKGIKGFAKIKCYGQEKSYYFMVMDLLGPSLADLYQFCGYRFSLKTTLMLAYQFIDRFEYMHKRKFVHRDIKPDNFLMGLKENSSTLYVVDMGLAKRYIDP